MTWHDDTDEARAACNAARGYGGSVIHPTCNRYPHPRCASCAHYVPPTQAERELRIGGDCRRMPPQLAEGCSAFPEVWPSWFCGEFRHG